MKKKIIWVMVILFVLVAAVVIKKATEERPILTGPYEVAKISEGDNYIIDMDGKETRVLLIGVDVPYSVKKSRKAAIKYASELIGDNNIMIEYDENKEDRHGRKLVYMYTKDMLMVNEEILKNGLGEYRNDNNGNKKYESRLIAATEVAQKEKVGIWHTK